MNFDRQSILDMKAQLEDLGYINDGQSIGATPFKARMDEIVSDLKSVGYNGKLEEGGSYFDGYGNLYWFYDPTVTSRAEALRLSKNYVASSKSDE